MTKEETDLIFAWSVFDRVIARLRKLDNDAALRELLYSIERINEKIANISERERIIK